MMSSAQSEFCGKKPTTQHACTHLASFFFQAEDGIRDVAVTGVQTCALPICVGILSKVEILKLNAHPARPYRAQIERVAFHSIWEIEKSRSTIRKIHGGSGNSVISCPDCRTLEVARKDQNSMQIDLPIEIESYPLTPAGPINSFNPRSFLISINRV